MIPYPPANEPAHLGDCALLPKASTETSTANVRRSSPRYAMTAFHGLRVLVYKAWFNASTPLLSNPSRRHSVRPEEDINVVDGRGSPVALNRQAADWIDMHKDATI